VSDVARPVSDRATERTRQLVLLTQEVVKGTSEIVVHGAEVDQPMRIIPVAPDCMDDAQRRVLQDAVSGPRGQAPKPFAAWLHSPELALRAHRLGEFIRFGVSLPPRLAKIAILVTARHWRSDYVWSTHSKQALALGMSSDVVQAIADGLCPSFADPAERAVHSAAFALLTTGHVDDQAYGDALAHLGQKGLVELTALVGYYSFTSMTLNMFKIDITPAEQPTP
jgi:4-carboxymuconolactone decarboxylase